MKPTWSHIFALALSTIAISGCGTALAGRQKHMSAHANAATQRNTASHPIPTTPQEQTVKLTAQNHITIDMMSARTGWGIVNGNHGQSRIVRTRDGGQTWLNVSPQGKNYTVTGQAFTGSNAAWVTIRPMTSGNQSNPSLILFHTQDGGRTWDAHRIPVHTVAPVYRSEISVVYPGTIMVDVIPQHGMGSMPGNLFQTHDNGRSWTQVSSGNEIPLGGRIHFVGTGTGWLSTAHCTTCSRALYRSTDQGRTWARIHVRVPTQFAHAHGSFALPQFSVTDPARGLLVATFQSRGNVIEQRGMFATRNGGQSWLYNGPIPGQAGLLSFANTHDGFALPMAQNKTFPTLDTTVDGGQSWTPVTLAKTPFSALLVHDVPCQLDFISKDVGWIVWQARRAGMTSDQIWLTRDGGHQWHRLGPSPATGQ